MPFDSSLELRAKAAWASSDLGSTTSERKTATGIDLKETGVKGLAAVVNYETALVDDGSDTVEADDYAKFIIAESDDDSTYNDLVHFDKLDKDSAALGTLIERFATSKRYVRLEVEFYNKTKSSDCALSVGNVEAQVSAWAFKVL